MKIKKILTIILLLFVTLGFLSPSVSAVQLYWESLDLNNNQQLPPVITNNGSSIFSFNNQDNSGVSGLVCAQPSDIAWHCSMYALNLTPFFVFDNTQNGEQYVHYSFDYRSRYFSIKKSDRLTNATAPDPDYVYFYYSAGDNYNQYAVNIPMAKVPRNVDCGTKDPNICVVWFHFYFYLTSGSDAKMYLSSYDMIKYNSPDDKMLFYNKEFEKIDPSGSFLDLIKWLKWGTAFWRPLWKINTNEKIATFWFNSTIHSIKMNGTDYEITSEYPDYMVKPMYSNNAYYLSFSNYNSFDTLQWNNVYIRDFFVGNNTDIRGNLPSYFWAQGLTSWVIDNNTNEPVTDPNIYNDPNFNKSCDVADVWCHIKNLSNSINYWFTLFINAIKWFFSNLWTWFFDIVKKIITWVWDWINTLFEPLTNIFNNIWDSIKNISKSFNFVFEDLWTREQIVCDANFNFSIPDNQREEAKLRFTNYINDTFPWIVNPLYVFSDNVITILHFISPFPPTNWKTICTYAGNKVVKYNNNTFVDIFFVLMCVFSMLSLLLYRRD